MITVTIREKMLNDGRRSLYLDIYDKGKRKREALDMYLLPETTTAVKVANKQTLKRAELARGRVLFEAQNPAFAIQPKERQIVHYLIPTFEEFSKGRNTRTYKTLLFHFRNICSSSMKVAQINERWINKLIDYLRDRGVIDNTIAEYIAKLRVFWRWCRKRGMAEGDPFEDIVIKTHSAVKEYLTIEEMQQLVNTPTKCRVRNIFLFSCFTGLRYSDIIKLRWKDVEQCNGRTRLVFRQQKTRSQEYMDINEQAVSLMGERCEGDWLVFGGWKECSSLANLQLRKWTESAGIHKHLTFHCARHTFATMLLTLDTDIYVVSKLLGHSSVKTTQVYAKIVDKKKQQAVDNIPQLL
jgi:site-specific recombinase XerD